MNGQDLMLGLNYISRKYIDEAEYDMLNVRTLHGKYAEKTGNSARVRRGMLIVSVIALTCVLVGCGVAYAFRFQNLKIGQATFPVAQYDDAGSPVGETEISLEVFSLQGIENSPNYLAAKEWLDFSQNYVFSGGEYWESDPDYWAYNVLNQEMVDQLNEICEKYGLKIIGKPWHEHSDCTAFLELAGVDALLKKDSGAQAVFPQGRFFPGGSFDIYGTLTMPVTEQTLSLSYSCIQKDVFYDVFGYLDPKTVTQRNYTTKDGASLLLLESDLNGMILADRENCFISLSVQGTDSASLEAIAEQLDFHIMPHALDVSAADALEQASLDEWNSRQNDPNILRRPTYGEYIEDLLQSDEMYLFDPKYTPPSKTYAFYDLDGNGTEEMLIFYDSYIGSIVAMKNGITDDGKSYHMYLCEGNVLIDFDSLPNARGEYWIHIFTFANDGDPVFSNSKERSIVRLKKDADGQWWRTSSTEHYAEFDTQITEDEAMGILNAYKPVELDTRPLSEFQEP